MGLNAVPPPPFSTGKTNGRRMKTVRGIWERVIDFENLHTAWRKARRGKRDNGDTVQFYSVLENWFHRIRNELIEKTWMPSPFREFIVNEPKLRMIQAPAFCDRIVHHALVRVVEPYFERGFITDSFACRRERGNTGASMRLRKFIASANAKWSNPYVLKADIKSYFPSINHDMMMERISRTIGDKNVLWLCDRIIRCNRYKVCGMPIGALTSQLFANVYLDALDHHIKDTMGVKYYIRYMDDFVVLGANKQELNAILDECRAFLGDRLHLTLNPKTSIFPLSHGVDFSGYRHWKSHVLPRKRNIRRARMRFKRISALYANKVIGLDYVTPRVMSFCGMMQHCDAYITSQSVLSALVLVGNGKQPEPHNLLPISA